MVDKSKQIPVYSLLALLCFLGMSIMKVSDGEDGFSITTFYLGLGLTLAGASLKIFTKAGIAILLAGIIGKIFFRSLIPITVSSLMLGCWYLLDFTLLREYQDKDM